ncbi:protein [Escherichia coli]|uniref:Protein n=1 Tax=Escherichia coli TaxID=562 RepID=A0A376TLP8_ECOLX|nr:protein [Escherichia coli]
MKSVFTISASLAISLMLCCTAQANDHKILGVIAMPRNETNDLALKLPVCRIVKRIQPLCRPWRFTVKRCIGLFQKPPVAPVRA